MVFYQIIIRVMEPACQPRGMTSLEGTTLHMLHQAILSFMLKQSVTEVELTVSTFIIANISKSDHKSTCPSSDVI